MPTPISDLNAKIFAQKTALPSMYGALDFDLTPERFAVGEDDETWFSAHGKEPLRRKLLQDADMVARMEAYSKLGDAVADAYAALIPEYGLMTLIEMLTTACDKGIEAVENAPPELGVFIRSMEETPDWLDMNLVEEGARLERNSVAHIAPFAVRGAFIATFMNKYAALPMVMTGTLGHATAARRVKETATFFSVTTMPGALERFGPGFKAAAMVRLMHSMVRFNVLSRGRWDQKVYGVPIPQVDQMPAGQIGSYLMSEKLLRQGRKNFTPAERALIELSRYRCFLLGLPEDLAPATPDGIVQAWLTRIATLRNGYDDTTCGELLRATMAARLVPDASLKNRIKEYFERSFSKIYFLQNFMEGEVSRAEAVGVPITRGDWARFFVVMTVIVSQMSAYSLAQKLPGLRVLADRRLVRKVRSLLDEFGHAEFTTDATKYRPAVAKAAE